MFGAGEGVPWLPPDLLLEAVLDLGREHLALLLVFVYLEVKTALCANELAHLYLARFELVGLA